MIFQRIKVAVVTVTIVVSSAGLAHASLITTFYGDDDGFGIGAFAGTINEDVSNDDVGEAPGTDVRLIGDSGFVAPAFAPLGGFDLFAVPGGETIVGATLTMRMGGFDSGPNPVDDPPFPNEIFLDGLLVDSTFIDGFTTDRGTLGEGIIETRSIMLGPAFFASLADGVVSLAGTHISEDSGSGSFQIDMLRLDIETAVPEPSVLLLLGSGALAMAVSKRRSVRGPRRRIAQR